MISRTKQSTFCRKRTQKREIPFLLSTTSLKLWLSSRANISFVSCLAISLKAIERYFITRLLQWNIYKHRLNKWAWENRRKSVSSGRVCFKIRFRGCMNAGHVSHVLYTLSPCSFGPWSRIVTGFEPIPIIIGEKSTVAPTAYFSFRFWPTTRAHFVIGRAFCNQRPSR